MVRHAGFALCAVAILAGSLVAQERQPVPPPRPAAPPVSSDGAITATRPGQQAQGSQQLIDAHVANCLILGNQEEIALLKFGMDKVDDKELKELTKSMIEDHQKFVSKLQQFASKGQSFELRAGTEGSSNIRRVGGTDDDRANPPGNRRDDANRNDRNDRNPRNANVPPGRGESAPGTAGNVGTNQDAQAFAQRLFAIDRRAKEECLKLTKEELNQYDGKEFDQAFLGVQAGKHIGMLAQLRAVEDAVSPQFQQLIQEGQKSTKEHKQRVQELMDQHSDRKSSKGNRNDE